MDAAIGEHLKAIPGTVGSRTEASALRVAQDEARYQAEALKDSVPLDLAFGQPSLQTLKSMVHSSPVQGKVMGKWWGELAEGTRQKITQQVNQGLINGESVHGIVRRIRGTKANGFKDGVLGTTRRQAEGLVRTQMTHVSAQAREMTAKANEDVVRGVQIVATLDARTSDICISLDGQVFQIDRGPRPSFHHQCRTTTVFITKSWKELGIPLQETTPQFRASMNGVVPAKQNYSQWLREQPKAFQDSVLGPTKAAMFRGNRLKLERLVTRDLKPRTIAELRAMKPGQEATFPGVLKESPPAPKATPSATAPVKPGASSSLSAETEKILEEARKQVEKAKALAGISESKAAVDLAKQNPLLSAKKTAAVEKLAEGNAKKLEGRVKDLGGTPPEKFRPVSDRPPLPSAGGPRISIGSSDEDLSIKLLKDGSDSTFSTKRVRDEIATWHRSRSKAELEALERWGFEAYGDIRTFEATGTVNTSLTGPAKQMHLKEVEAYTRNLHRALESAPKIHGSAYRGITVAEEFVEELATKKTFEWNQTSSWSVDPGAATAFAKTTEKGKVGVVFRVDSGNMRPLGPQGIFSNEKEVMSLVGSRFRVKSITRHSDRFLVELDDITPASSGSLASSAPRPGVRPTSSTQEASDLLKTKEKSPLKDRSVKKRVRAWEKSLDDGEKASLKSWGSGDYRDIQKQQKFGVIEDPVSARPDQIPGITETFDRALRKAPDIGGVHYRGMTLSDAVLENIANGDLLEWDHSLSWSGSVKSALNLSDPGLAGSGFVPVIVRAKSSRMKSLGRHSTFQVDEVVSLPESKFRVTAITKAADGRTIVDVEEVFGG